MLVPLPVEWRKRPILRMDEILHHFQTSPNNYFGGAEFCPSTVQLVHQLCTVIMLKEFAIASNKCHALLVSFLASLEKQVVRLPLTTVKRVLSTKPQPHTQHPFKPRCQPTHPSPLPPHPPHPATHPHARTGRLKIGLPQKFLVSQWFVLSTPSQKKQKNSQPKTRFSFRLPSLAPLRLQALLLRHGRPRLRRAAPKAGGLAESWRLGSFWILGWVPFEVFGSSLPVWGFESSPLPLSGSLGLEPRVLCLSGGVPLNPDFYAVLFDVTWLSSGNILHVCLLRCGKSLLNC